TGCSSPTPTGPVTIKVGLGYIPSIQFAQFYLALQRGYYRDAGLDVTLQNGDDAQILTLLGQGALDIGLSDGTSIIPAVSRDIPVKYVATIYAKFPSVVFSKVSSGIATPADLDGRSLGIPAKSGSSWIMLQALLASAGLTPDDLAITVYPDYGQRVAVQQDQVDSATGFVNNEPVQMRLAGEDVTVLTVDDITPLPGPGMVVGTATLGTKGVALKAFVAATLRAMAEIKADPQDGYAAALAYVPELADDPTTALAVLEATAAQWSSAYTDANGLGSINQAAWDASVGFMSGLPDTVVAKPVTFDQLATQELLP
ncbi:MAG: ABC transporter substrate-binding protein, partial [Candidatus Limnocylindrales bacterium]